jgi:DNA polymerase-3 subunit delta
MELPKSGDLPIQGSWLLVQGGEEHLKRLLVERLRAQLLTDDDAFNFDQLDVSENWDGVKDTQESIKRQPSRVDRILGLAQALPFLGSGRLVMVRNVDLLANDQQKKLAAGIATVPTMNHVLLITGEGDSGKKSTKLAADLLKGIEKSGVIYDCAPLSEGDAAAWVKNTLTTWKQRIEPAALTLLISRAGTELRRLQIEVEKLSLLVGEGGAIRLADVELLTPKLAEESVFHLTDAVAERNAKQALTILRELLEEQMEQPYRIFPLLVRQFRMLWQTKVMLDAGWRPNSDPNAYPQAVAMLPTSNALGQIGGWMGRRLATPARQISWDHLADAYQALLECDMAGKAIDGVPRQEMDLALEILCVKLCR